MRLKGTKLMRDWMLDLQRGVNRLYYKTTVRRLVYRGTIQNMVRLSRPFDDFAPCSVTVCSSFPSVWSMLDHDRGLYRKYRLSPVSSVMSLAFFDSPCPTISSNCVRCPSLSCRRPWCTSDRFSYLVVVIPEGMCTGFIVRGVISRRWRCGITDRPFGGRFPRLHISQERNKMTSRNRIKSTFVTLCP